MHLKTILNRVENYQSFVYGKVKLQPKGEQLELEVHIHPRRNSRGQCAGCGQKRPGYDTLPERRFEFVPLWGILVYFVYAMRRVDCPQCGVKVGQVPWAQGKRTVTNTYGWFLARWAKRMSWSEVASTFHTSWHIVYRAVEMAVAWGRHHMNLDGITAIGVDEMPWGQGHRYLTVVYQINQNCKRLLWVGEKRTVKTLLLFFRWLLLKRPENLTDNQQASLAQLLQYNLKAVKSYLLKEQFQFFWEYSSPYWAGVFPKKWCTRVMRSRIEPMKKVAKMLRNHQDLILNWFRAQKEFSSGIVEGFNAKAKLTTRKAYGFREFKTLQVALYHNLGNLPEPELAHEYF